SAQVRDLDGLDRVRRLEAEYLAVEAQLRLRGANDVLRAAEAVLLALEFQISDRYAALAQRGHDTARLLGRNDTIFAPLEGDERCLEALEVVDGRARVIRGFALRQRRNELVEIAAFELVGIAREREQLAHPAVIGACPKGIRERERGESRESTGTAAADRGAFRVDASAPGEVTNGVDNVLEVHDAPPAVETVTVLAAEAR